MERLPQQIKEVFVMRDIILNMVNAHQGIKAVDLALKVMSEVNPVIFNIEEYWDALNSLIGSKEIVEIEYTLPQLSYRLKSIYFPKGTAVYGNFIDFTKSEECRDIERHNAEASGV